MVDSDLNHEESKTCLRGRCITNERRHPDCRSWKSRNECRSSLGSHLSKKMECMELEDCVGGMTVGDLVRL